MPTGIYKRRSRPTEPRFWAKVRKAATCWLWIGAKGGNGTYGYFWDGKRNVYAHRYAYSRYVGPIPPGLTIDHLCRNPLCVRPSHLEAVTLAENIRRGEAGQNNATKTHCKRGHPYDAENTYSNPSGRRECRTCKRLWEAKRGRL